MSILKEGGQINLWRTARGGAKDKYLEVYSVSGALLFLRLRDIFMENAKF